MDYVDDIAILNEDLISLELEISTVDAHNADSSDLHYVNILFSDSTRLYEPFNLKLYNEFGLSQIPVCIGTLPHRGKTKRFTLPVPPSLNRKLIDIAEVFIRKDGSDGWLAGSILLFANGHSIPLIGNSNVNQFLDNDNAVLMLRDWSTGSFCVAPATSARDPLPRSGYRVLGPVVGQVSDTSAVIIYRLDRAGYYRFRAFDTITNLQVHDETQKIEPTYRFNLTGLLPNRRYEFNLSYLRGGLEYLVPDGSGAFFTYPPEGSHGQFTFAFGSCVKSKKQIAQGSWTAIKALAESPSSSINPVRLFVHLGDTFYFYDHVTKDVPHNVESMHAAHVSMRRHLEFLDMAKVVPSCGIWDDHDFAGNDNDSKAINSDLRMQAVWTWLQYWGNQPISPKEIGKIGLTTRISYGLVDIYLLDSRFRRDKDRGIFFGNDIINKVLDTIDIRGAEDPRVVILGTGISWNHHAEDGEGYGQSIYDDERDRLYKELAIRMGRTINGLLFISGDTHINEIYHVDLGGGRMAPEFVSSPLTRNTGLRGPRDIRGERVASFSSKEKRGFATLTIDTSRYTRDNWTATMRYFQEATGDQYQSRSYTLSNGQFNPDPSLNIKL
ncbi:alkaline phosphatase D family protein [Candidatus Nitrosocosmicus hydrocola]|uniref:alkaline phosphatase D family protein n=1 Tax=Candidatus Nitrosocosmicus hydrocola TaxID=1826872 RepID=UPI0011E5D1C7|nr:alkaline phosphatase D family protein [Candidatus Nitrosocosmicus hydrocola]